LIRHGISVLKYESTEQEKEGKTESLNRQTEQRLVCEYVESTVYCDRYFNIVCSSSEVNGVQHILINLITIATMSTIQQYENFYTKPLFIMVGEKGSNNTTNFYKAPRDVIPIASLQYNHTLENLSLIIAALFLEMPERVMKKNKRIIDWEKLTGYIRYFGLVDLDMPLEEVLIGKQPLIQEEEPEQYANMDALKLKWSTWLKEHSDQTIAQIRTQCVAFDTVCKDAEELAKALTEKGRSFLFFFSGCKGFRLLWYDSSLFYWVLQKEDYAKAYKQQIAMKYFTELGCSPLFVSRLDCSVYDKNKGVKPDVLAHPDSQLYSFVIHDYTQLNQYQLCRLQKDEQLIEKVKQFWTGLPHHCPLKIPHLRAMMNGMSSIADSMIAKPIRVPRPITTTTPQQLVVVT
jgi:hypothetical protein